MDCLIFNWRCWKHPQAGGAEIYLYEISKRLAAKGHKITWFVSSFNSGCSEEYIDGIEIIRRGGKFSVYLYSLWYYITKFRKLGVDIIVDDINGVPFFTPLYIWTPKKVAVLHHIVGRDIFFRELPFFPAILALCAEKSIPFIYSHISFITVSESSKLELEENSIRNINVIPNGINISLEYQYSVPKSTKPTILYLGRLKMYKRIDMLIEAFKLVKNEIIDAELWIAGAGDWITNENVNGLTFFGKVSEEKKIELLSKSWVFVTPSLKEGWGITVIEANACGTPCIAYNVPGLRDSILDGKTGLLVDDIESVEKLSEKIIKIIKDEKFREILRTNALNWASRFNWDKSAESFEKLIKTEDDL